MGGVRLTEAIDSTLLRLWPRRAHQESLLDLGEHKRWTNEDRERAVGSLATWLASELGLPSHIEPADRPPAVPPARIGAALPVIHPLRPADRPPGVGARVARLASLAGVVAKTLSNSLSQGTSSARFDHRWIGVLKRIERTDAPIDAWLYHRRTRASVTSELRRWSTGGHLDTGDALLAFSLVALWQRRRPTSAARASLGKHVPRRILAKPIASLAGSLLRRGQVDALTTEALLWGGPHGRAVLSLVLECALTEAHIEAHAPRSARTARAVAGDRGRGWLDLVDEILDRPAVAPLLPATARGLFRFRSTRMRAFLLRRATAGPSIGLARNPYVRASLYLERSRGGGARPLRLAGDLPGLLMLEPQLRSAGARR